MEEGFWGIENGVGRRVCRRKWVWIMEDGRYGMNYEGGMKEGFGV